MPCRLLASPHMHFAFSLGSSHPLSVHPKMSLYRGFGIIFVKTYAKGASKHSSIEFRQHTLAVLLYIKAILTVDAQVLPQQRR